MTTTADISGATRTVFVVADPILQVKTPSAQNAVWTQRGADVVTLPAHVASDELSAFLAGLRSNRSALGAVITIPHKQSAGQWCDELGPYARMAGAVNVIRRGADGRLIGETFDGLGFVAGLRSQGFEPIGRNVHLFGAGGAASAIAAALANADVASITVANRTVSRAQALVDRIHRSLGFTKISVASGESASADLVVNATSMGMGGSTPVDIPRNVAAPGALAADVVVADSVTPFLSSALEQGMRAHGGIHMLNGQMELIADYLLGE